MTVLIRKAESMIYGLINRDEWTPGLESRSYVRQLNSKKQSYCIFTRQGFVVVVFYNVKAEDGMFITVCTFGQKNEVTLGL